MNAVLWLVRKSKTEIKIVLVTLFLLFTLPIVSLLVVGSSGIALVGQALAAVNPVTHLVDIFDANGTKVNSLELSTTWPTNGSITDVFGSYQPWRQELGFGAHNGIDIANAIDTPITPFTTGVILQSHDKNDNSCGKYVRIDHGYGVTSLYCHMNATAGLAKDTSVKPGDVIGYMGTTGTSTGVHLHFMTMVYGIPVNPQTFMVGEPTGGTADEQPAQ